MVPIESTFDVPFDIQRIYYIYNVTPDAVRGHHAHRKLHQVLLCLNGSVTIRTSNGKDTEEYELNSPNEGLYIGNMIWREMYNFSQGAVLLVLASQLYSEKDYIRDFTVFLEEARQFYSLNRSEY